MGKLVRSRTYLAPVRDRTSIGIYSNIVWTEQDLIKSSSDLTDIGVGGILDRYHIGLILDGGWNLGGLIMEGTLLVLDQYGPGGILL